jgi:UPF0271 protein
MEHATNDEVEDVTLGVTLNVDLGELEEEPIELYQLATQVNVACGGHAGDARSMRDAVGRAIAASARIAAHPSYPDRAGFGRRRIAIAPHELSLSIEAQCEALRAVAEGAGTHVRIVKPHGALYHDVAEDGAIAAAFFDAVVRVLGRSIEIVGPPRARSAIHARARGLSWLAEGFADRAYGPDGRLVPRGKEGAVIESPAAAAAQAVAIARSGSVATICVHGDTTGAVAIARAVRTALEAEGLLS